MSGRVLFLDVDHTAYDRVGPALRSAGFDVAWCASADDLTAAADEGDVDVAVVAVEIEENRGDQLCSQITVRRPDVRVILVGDTNSFEAARGALRAGAFDYFVRPLSAEELEPSLQRALEQRPLQEEVRRLRTALAEASSFEELIGVSPAMVQLYELLEQAAASNASVLITGESGTGKELVARALHKRSRRADGPFVAVNCSAIPDNLLESELFGHVKGAFTDARVSRSGLFVKATGGTVFLDEIGDMPMSLQPKLLRALQERHARPVGGDVEVPFDVRVVAATNKNLEVSVAEKEFREDLFYRINVIHIDIPPLRERASDVVLLAQHYVEHFALLSEKHVVGLSPAAAEKILAYPWPGNVRELQNCMERAVALTRGEEIAVSDLPEKVRKHKRNHVLVVSSDPSELVPMEEIERRYVQRVIQAVGGNKKEAARILGFDRKTLYRKLERYAIEVPKKPVLD
jgi:two-component system response regulator HydG